MMVDARAIVPAAQQMVDACIPIAEGVESGSDFTVTLYIKRRGSDVEVDANVSVRQPKKGKPHDR